MAIKFRLGVTAPHYDVVQAKRTELEQWQWFCIAVAAFGFGAAFLSLIGVIEQKFWTILGGSAICGAAMFIKSVIGEWLDQIRAIDTLEAEQLVEVFRSLPADEQLQEYRKNVTAQGRPYVKAEHEMLVQYHGLKFQEIHKAKVEANLRYPQT